MSRRSREIPAPSRRARALLGFLAVLVATAHLAAISHMAFVAHAICAEHGTLVHVESRAAPAAPADGAEEVAPRVAPGEEPAEDEHDHCVVGVTQPGEGQVARAAAGVVVEDARPAVVPLPAPASVPAASVPPPPPISILLLSPKSSPPV